MQTVCRSYIINLRENSHQEQKLVNNHIKLLIYLIKNLRCQSSHHQLAHRTAAAHSKKHIIFMYIFKNVYYISLKHITGPTLCCSCSTIDFSSRDAHGVQLCILWCEWYMGDGGLKGKFFLCLLKKWMDPNQMPHIFCTMKRNNVSFIKFKYGD